jgi:hypothetical protein
MTFLHFSVVANYQALGVESVWFRFVGRLRVAPIFRSRFEHHDSFLRVKHAATETLMGFY